MISKIIHQRRSVYPEQYSDKPISQEVIRELLLAAHQAPTHRKTQPWRFNVFHSEESREALGNFLAKKYRDTVSNYSEFKEKKIHVKVKKSGCVIAINRFRDPKESVPAWEETAALAMAVQNMWLLCTELGIGCYWSTPAMHVYLNEHIEMHEQEQCFGFFYMGYFNGPLTAAWERNPLDQHVQWF